MNFVYGGNVLKSKFEIYLWRGAVFKAESLVYLESFAKRRSATDVNIHSFIAFTKSLLTDGWFEDWNEN